MLGMIRQDRRYRALMGVVLALVLAMRLAAPAGFMPVMTAKGVMITLCTGQGAMKVAVDPADTVQARMKHPGGHDDGGDAAKDHCPFAGMAAAPALPSVDLALSLPVWHRPTGPIAFALRTGWIARLAAPPPPSSGPPAFLA